MRVQDQPVYTYRRTGLLFHLYRDRIEVAERKHLKPEASQLALADIRSVELTELPDTLTIVLHNDARYVYQMADEAPAAHKAILRLLQGRAD